MCYSPAWKEILPLFPLSLSPCLFLGIGHPGSRLKRVSSAVGVFADLLLAKAGGGCVALGQSLYRSRHQTFLILLVL